MCPLFLSSFPPSWKQFIYILLASDVSVNWNWNWTEKNFRNFTETETKTEKIFKTETETELQWFLVQKTETETEMNKRTKIYKIIINLCSWALHGQQWLMHIHNRPESLKKVYKELKKPTNQLTLLWHHQFASCLFVENFFSNI